MTNSFSFDGMRIRTAYDPPPVPFRDMDWSAWIDGKEESCIIGRGLTESDAVAELLLNVYGEG